MGEIIMEGVIFTIGLAMVFFIMSGFLYQGKGSWLISGYNTAPKRIKQKYDKLKLCRATAVIIDIVGLMLLVVAYFAYRVETGLMAEDKMLPIAIAFIVVSFIGVGVHIYYVNTRCKK